MSDVRELLARLAHGEAELPALEAVDGTPREAELLSAINGLTAAVKEANEQRDRARRDLQTFVSAASHDLRSPLHTMNGFSALLSRFCSDRLEGAGLEYLSYIRGAIETQLSIIGGLATWARVYSRGEAAETIEMSWLREAALAELNGPEVGENDVRWGKLPTALVGDRAQIAIALGRLIGNALLYRERPGLVEVSCVRDGDAWRFAVRDDGIGIAPDYHDVIFSPCKRLHTVEEFPGVGMGLPVAARIAERHGGGLRVESQSGVGSSFFLEIPVAPTLRFE